MKALLVTLAGPLEGEVIEVAPEGVTIGREPSNRLCLPDSVISRQHARIEKTAHQYRITDLGSLNGTRVNGGAIQERLLELGDQIEIGDSVWLFVIGPGGPSRAQESAYLDDTLTAGPDSTFWGRGEASTRVSQDLSAMLRITSAVYSMRALYASRHRVAQEVFARHLLGLLFEVVPAERGALLLAGESDDEFGAVLGWDRASDRPVRVSRAIVTRVLREGVSVFSNDVLHDTGFSTSQTLLAQKVRSVLAVPVIIFEQTLGVIYLDSTERGLPFEESHLQLVTAVACVAAMALENARYLARLEGENRRLREEINVTHSMVGDSTRMREVLQFIGRVALTDATVLIRGESGTGKELVARAVHGNSARASKPFIAINCAAIPETLLESELFGHEKGAFTGAVAQKKGKFELADGGTVFLDEIGEVAPAVQAKLLRVLQERELERVGGSRPIKVDIRLLAATNADLEGAIQRKTFRPDLFYRLNVVAVTVPPLRQRREDVVPLAEYFATKHSQRCKRPVRGLSPQAKACLLRYEWPGNIRELENAIERAVVLGTSELILPEDLPPEVLDAAPRDGLPGGGLQETLQLTKKQLVLKAIEKAGGNHADAAKTLGLHPIYLHRLIRNLDLKAAVQDARLKTSARDPGLTQPNKGR